MCVVWKDTTWFDKRFLVKGVIVSRGRRMRDSEGPCIRIIPKLPTASAKFRIDRSTPCPQDCD